MEETQELEQQAEGETCILPPKAVFGFEGHVAFGLNMHPDGVHTVIPLGHKVVITNLETNKQEFLVGHTNKVSCLQVSQSGKYIASGQLNHMGFRAYVILWDYEECKEIARHDLHKVRCETVNFTARDKYVVSVGGVYDGCIIIFDVQTRTPICRAVVANSKSGQATYVCALNKKSSVFLVSGDRHLRMWKVERERRKLSVQEVQTGRHQRIYTSMEIDNQDDSIYIGTMTGDVAHVRLHVEANCYSGVLVGLYGKHNPKKPIGKDCEKYVNGVRELLLTEKGDLLLGAGDGTIELVRFRKESFKNYPNPTWPMLATMKSTKVNGAVTSLARNSDRIYYIGTENSEIYRMDITTFELKLKLTCHKECVNMLTFPKNTSTVFASAGYESIRIWSMRRLQELLRIVVYNFRCMAIVFAFDGSSIMSAWNDGVIRCFTPISGKLIFAIPNAHNKGCCAIGLTPDNKTLISAGIEGQIRVWKIEPYCQTLMAVLKDHSGPITSLTFSPNRTEMAAAGIDGCCVIWDLKRLVRMHAINSATQFTSIRFTPDGTQILTAGSDGHIGYWMTYNGKLLREVTVEKEALHSLSFSPCGSYFVSAGEDQYVKIWDFEKGVVVCAARQHAAAVKSVRFSPCGKHIISASIIGSIIIWNVPKQFWGKQHLDEEEASKATKNSNPCRGKNRENINGLEASRKNKGVLCAECPPVDTNAQPNISCK